MDILSTLILGAVVTGLTQGMKKMFPEVNSLIWVAILSFLVGLFYGIIVPILPQELIEKAIYSFGIAIGIYETLSSFVKKD